MFMTAGSAYGVIATTRRQAASACSAPGMGDVLRGLDAAQQHAGGERRLQHAADVQPGAWTRAFPPGRRCGKAPGKRETDGIAALRQEAERRTGLFGERRGGGADVREMRVAHCDAAQHDRSAPA